MHYHTAPVVEGDIKSITKLHLKAFKGHLNILLGGRYNSAFFKWFIAQNNTIHLKCVSDRKELVGYIVGAPWGYQPALNKFLIPYALQAILTRPWVVLNPRILKTIRLRIFILLGLNNSTKKTQAIYDGLIISLVGIAVSEEFLGKGGASFLLNRFISEAKLLGYDYIRLSVYSTNTRARKFYENNGFQLEKESMNLDVVGYFFKLNT